MTPPAINAFFARTHLAFALVSDTLRVALAVGYCAALLSLAARVAGPALSRMTGPAS